MDALLYKTWPTCVRQLRQHVYGLHTHTACMRPNTASGPKIIPHMGVLIIVGLSKTFKEQLTDNYLLHLQVTMILTMVERVNVHILPGVYLEGTRFRA